ncbi:MAG: transposase [Rhodospirillales bacterium]|jgi:REP element-mobilizing transposase RayT|nr:transposase [Rhodospirillales bacterium]MDP7216466.1 transposase [Rhodospirillales bacterium]HJP54023.1 transposase [Rhodospirillales bacterium]
MARPLRIEYPGAVYHLTARGNAREDIFLDDGDRRLFLDLLAETIARFRWLCHAYCLMGNHYHLLIETPEANLSRGMRHLNGVYTQRFNRTHGRVGHVFQGRYKAILVERDAHLLELCRYLVLNPVRAGMVRSARNWRWSSHRAMAGQVAAPEWLATDWLLARFGRRAAPARAAYRRFVIDGRGEPLGWDGRRGRPRRRGVPRRNPRPRASAGCRCSRNSRPYCPATPGGAPGNAGRTWGLDECRLPGTRLQHARDRQRGGPALFVDQQNHSGLGREFNIQDLTPYSPAPPPGNSPRYRR